jgi:hypothetical protein
MKIPGPQGVITVYGDQQEAKNIERDFVPGQHNMHCITIEREDNNSPRPTKHKKVNAQLQSNEGTKTVPLDPATPKQTVLISEDLSPNEEARLLSFLNRNKDVFAWSALDLVGVSRTIIEHTLGINSSVRPWKQRLRKMPDEKTKTTTYVDDIIVASKNKDDHLSDLAETFTNMREDRLQLNPKNASLVYAKAKILGYLVSHKGIEANRSKIQAIMDMAPLQSTKYIQRLTGRFAALNRFISRSAERCLPFLKTLSGAKDFTWGTEQDVAFESLKQYLFDLAALTRPDLGLPLLLYIVASPNAVSTAMVQEKTREGKTHQCPVYFVSEVCRHHGFVQAKTFF